MYSAVQQRRKRSNRQFNTLFFLVAVVLGALIWFAAYRFLLQIRGDHTYDIGSDNKYVSFLMSFRGKSTVNETERELAFKQIEKQNDRIIGQFLESVKSQRKELQWSIGDLWKPVAEWSEGKDDSLPVIVFTSLENPVIYYLCTLM